MWELRAKHFDPRQFSISYSVTCVHSVNLSKPKDLVKKCFAQQNIHIFVFINIEKQTEIVC